MQHGSFLFNDSLKFQSGSLLLSSWSRYAQNDIRFQRRAQMNSPTQKMRPSDRERRKRRTMNGRLGLALHCHSERSRGISNFFARGIARDVSTIARHDK